MQKNHSKRCFGKFLTVAMFQIFLIMQGCTWKGLIMCISEIYCALEEELFFSTQTTSYNLTLQYVTNLLFW